MRLLAIPEPAGRQPTLWINADHLVSVQRIERGAAAGRELVAELKVDGMPLHRVTLGTFLEKSERDDAWTAFLAQLQADATK